MAEMDQTPTTRTELGRDPTARREPLEKEALLSRGWSAEYGAGSWAQRIVQREPVKDAMTYHTQDVGKWTSLMYISYTVWNRKSLWMTALHLLLLSVVTACVVVTVCHDPAALKVDQFERIGSFLRVFVGLLLGFFMSASVNRWWSCVESFLSLCGTVRKLQMMMSACGIPEKQSIDVLRLGVLSAWMLHFELNIHALPSGEQTAAGEKHFTALRQCSGSEGFDKTFAKLSPEEADELEHLADPAGTLWMWIGHKLGRFVEDGHFRLLSAPAFGRCMTLSGEGLDKILKVRSLIEVQAPYIYVQMLASIVHINNIFNALSFGMTAGVTVGTWLAYKNINPFTTKEADNNTSHGESSRDLQSFLVAFFFSCFGPFVYQALLEVSIAIAQPFSNTDAMVPTKRFVHMLERDLHDAMKTTKQIMQIEVKQEKMDVENGHDGGDGLDGEDGDGCEAGDS